MLKIVRALCVLFLLCAASARATDRTITHSGEIPSSTLTNQQTRDDRIGLGILVRDALGVNAAAGAYANISIVPNGGMYVAAQPTSSGPGSLYQIEPEDPLPLPQNEVTQLSVDSTPVGLIGLQNGPVGAIGPMTAPTSGSSVVYLVEAQITTVDGPAVSVAFQNVTGGKNYESLPVDRTDLIVYQTIAGNASSTPTAPAVTAGWVGIATVTIPSGTTAITSSMIAALPPFGGFVANGAALSVTSLTLPETSPGCLEVLSGGAVSSLPCSTGVGAVNGSYPIGASQSGGTVTVSCNTCVTNVSGANGITSTGGTTPTLGLGNISPAGIYLQGQLDLEASGTATASNTSYSSSPLILSTSYYSGGQQTIHLPYLNTYFDGTNVNFSFNSNDSSPDVGLVRAGGFVGNGAQLTNLPNQLTHGDYCDTSNAQTCGGRKDFSGGIEADGNGTSGGMITLRDTSNTSNAPAKYVRANGTNGNLEIVNNASSAVIASLSDGGAFTTVGAGTFGGAGSFAGQLSVQANANGNVPNSGNTVVLTSNISTGNAEADVVNTNRIAATQVNPAVKMYAIDNSGNTLTLSTFYRDGDFGTPGDLYWGQNSYDSSTPNLFDGHLGALGWNYSGGAGEDNFFDLYNTTNTTNVAFDWRTLNNSVVTQLARLDRSGNFYANAYYSTSTRTAKRDIRQLDLDPLDVVRKTNIVTYQYVNDSAKTPRRIGYIAEDTPSILSGPKHDHFDLNANSAISLAAIKELDTRLALDEQKINDPRNQLPHDQPNAIAPLVYMLFGVVLTVAVMMLLALLLALKR